MPAVSERFKTYRAFASATLEDIYGPYLDQAYEVSANHLESGIYLNSSNQTKGIQFEWIPLPWEAQMSPVNDCVAHDFNHDGKPELILAQNHYSNWIETGLWRGRPGCHLEWNGSGFTTLSHMTSGIILPNDTKSITILKQSKRNQAMIAAAQNNDKLMLFKVTENEAEN